jgi:two-component system response regulator ResD
MPDSTALLISRNRLSDPTAVVRGLARRDLAVVWAHSEGEAFDLLAREGPQVVLLDLATANSGPDHGAEALQLCQRLRFLTQVPILILALPQERPTVLRALGLGIDAFQFKPIDAELLVAALSALRRRQSLEREDLPNAVRVRELEIDRERVEVRLRGEAVPLTPTEFRILDCLARNLGSVVSARQLLQEAQGYPCTEREAQQIVKVHIRHLRGKLSPHDEEQSYIANVRGFGYLLERRTSPRADDPIVQFTDHSAEEA